MASITLLRNALAANLDAIPETNVSAYVKREPQLPSLQVKPGAITYDAAMGRGHDDVTLVIVALVGLNDDQAGQDLLDRYLDNVAPYSVKHAAESDATLGGLCDDLHVSGTTPVEIVIPATGGELLTVEWTVEIFNPGGA